MKSEFLILGLMIFLVPVFVSASVVINEIAWMGIVGNQYGEWIELYNNGNEEIDLNNWKLYEDGGNVLIFTLTKKITPNSYLVIERTTDSSPDPLPDINDESGKFGGSGLVNLPGGEYLVLKDSTSNVVEDLNFSTGWPAGDNTTKQTMQLTSSGWITATGTPKAANAGASMPSEPPSPQPENSSAPQTSQSSSAGNSVYVAPEKLPHIKVSAGPDKSVVVGALSEFRGLALGLENEPLENARYLWVFGDGSLREGQNVNYFYQYPGEYIVALNVASAEYSASDYLYVKAAPNQFFISEIKPGENGPADSGASWIEFENKSKEEINISGCQIKQGNQIFTFPQATRVKSGAFLVVPSSVSKINFPSGKGIVEFFYPGGFKADSFSYEGFVSENQSFNRGSGLALIASQSPSAKNLIYVASPQKNPILPNDKNLAAVAKNSPDFSNSENNIATDTNPAAIVIGQPENTENKALIYLAAAFGVAISAIVAILFIRRKRGGEHLL